MPQLFLNNFDSQFIASVKSAPTTGTPATELDYGVLRITSGAAAALGTLTGGDYYILTAFKRSGTVESNIEIMRVTNIDTSVINETRITVTRAQEGTTAQSYVSGDYISLRLTKGGADNFLQKTGNLAGLDNTATARTNLGLGSMATQAANSVAITGGSISGVTITGFAPLASPTFTGTPAGPTAAVDTNTTQLATTAFVVGQASATNPAMNGTVAIGTSLRYARADHVHASDTTRAALASANTFTAAQTIQGNLTLDGTARRLLGDFSNATASNRVMVQSSTTNGATSFSALPNGTSTTGQFVAYNSSDPANAALLTMASLSGEVTIRANQAGTGSNLPITFWTTAAERLRIAADGNVGIGTQSPNLFSGARALTLSSGVTGDAIASLEIQGSRTSSNSGFAALSFYHQANRVASITSRRQSANDEGDLTFFTQLAGGSLTERARINPTGTMDVLFGFRETRVVVAASDINLNLGNYFTRTISGATTFTVSNAPASGTTAAFILELTNGGSATVTWWSGVRWAGGTAPTLTASGVDIISFYSHDGGTNWRGALIAKDSK